MKNEEIKNEELTSEEMPSEELKNMAMTNMKRHTFSCVLPAPLERVRLRLRSCMKF
jgi:hypothetical protein